MVKKWLKDHACETGGLAVAWRFKTMQISGNSLPRFFILFGAQKGNAAGLLRRGRSVAKDNGTCQDWQSTMSEEKGEAGGRGCQ